MCRHLLAVAAFAIVFFRLPSFAQAHHSETRPGPTIPPEAANGQKAFVQACGFCHGEDASGSRAPDLIRSALVNHDQMGNLIDTVIRNGRLDKGMPAFPASSLSDVQLASIVAFLHARAAQARGSANVHNDYPLEKLLTGDASAGKAYFNGEGGCAQCHSPGKDLKGVATKYQPINLQQRFLYPAGSAKQTATVTVPGSQPLEGEIIHLDAFFISLRDAEGWTHSWSRDAVAVEIHDPLAAHRQLLTKYTDQDVHNVFAYLETLK